MEKVLVRKKLEHHEDRNYFGDMIAVESPEQYKESDRRIEILSTLHGLRLEGAMRGGSMPLWELSAVRRRDIDLSSKG